MLHWNCSQMYVYFHQHCIVIAIIGKMDLIITTYIITADSVKRSLSLFHHHCNHQTDNLLHRYCWQSLSLFFFYCWRWKVQLYNYCIAIADNIKTSSIFYCITIANSGKTSSIIIVSPLLTVRRRALSVLYRHCYQWEGELYHHCITIADSGKTSYIIIVSPLLTMGRQALSFLYHHY